MNNPNNHCYVKGAILGNPYFTNTAKGIAFKCTFYLSVKKDSDKYKTYDRIPVQIYGVNKMEWCRKNIKSGRRASILGEFTSFSYDSKLGKKYSYALTASSIEIEFEEDREVNASLPI